MTSEQQEKAYEIISIEDNEFYDNVSFHIQDFESENPYYTVFFNGRSGGYLVLSNKNDNSTIDFIEEYEEYEEYDITSLRTNVTLLQDFDKLCDTLLEELKYYCDNYKVVEKTIQVSKTINVLVEV